MANELSSKKYKIEWIAVRNLAVVWPEAQRPYQEWWAKEIAAEFDPDKFDPVKVTLPNGNGIYHICEGQHRKSAVEILWGPNEQVPCLVAQDADPGRAAEIFLGANTSRNYVNKIAKFNVAVTAERKTEVNINKIVHHNGYRVDGSHGKDTIAAVDALKFAYNKGPKTLDRTLRVLRDTWSGDPSAVVSSLLKGYASFICEFSADLDFTKLANCMAKKFTPGQLAIQAKGVKETLHITVTAAVVHLILETYNRGLRTKLKRKKT
jgi:hypothetical protein